MRTYDLTPLFRASVGFDRFADLFDNASRADNRAASFPPYNIVKSGDDAYRITMAVAGFGDDDLSVTVQDGLLVVAGKHAEEADEAVGYLHRGIAARGFERRFSLADHVKVVDATLTNGLLRIDLAREIPEAKKPRQIAIRAAAPTAQVMREASA